MANPHILLLFGGQSSEHDVSIMSARNVAAAIDQSKYTLTLCYIDEGGSWTIVDDVDSRRYGVPLTLDLSTATFARADGKKLKPDVILPILHGQYGEDGAIQGMAKMLGIPCAGPDTLSAAVTMDKDMTKRLVATAGVPVVEWRLWHIKQPRPTYSELAEALGKTLFVKPNAAGSSVGVSKVNTQLELDAAFDEAQRHDMIVLIEQAHDVREIELAVLGNDDPIVTEPGEILPGEAFYSYDDKYAEGSHSSVRIPAELDTQTIDALKEYALNAYEAVGGHGMARVDFFIDKTTGRMYLNEINSIPGFTNISMYPKLWQHAGVSYPELIDRLIKLALE